MDSDDYHNEFSFHCLCAYTYILSFEKKSAAIDQKREEKKAAKKLNKQRTNG